MSEVNAAFEKWHDEFYGPQDKYSGIRSLERFPKESGLGDSYIDSTVCAQFTAFKAIQPELSALQEELAEMDKENDRLLERVSAAERRNAELVELLREVVEKQSYELEHRGARYRARWEETLQKLKSTTEKLSGAESRE